MAFGARGGAITTFPTPDVMKTRVSVGDQLDSITGSGANMWGLINSLRKKKEKERRAAKEWDDEQALRQARRLAMLEKELAPDPLEGVADEIRASELMSKSKVRGMMSTKDLLDRLRSGEGAPGYGQSMGNQFFNMPAAAAMTGVDLPRSGFEVYADLAQAGQNPAAYEYASREGDRKERERSRLRGYAPAVRTRKKDEEE
jgi:hypothetical protein